MVRKLLKNKTIANAGWLLGGQTVRKLLVFLVSVITARYLGPDNFGLINYSIAYIVFFTAVSTLGIRSVIIKVFEDHPEEAGTTIGTTLVLRGASSLLSMLAIIGIVSVVDRGEPVTITVAALTSVSMLFQIFEALAEWFQWRLQSKYSAIATILAYIVVSVYKISLLVTGMSVEWFAISNAIEYLAVAVCLLIAYRKNNGPRFSFSMTKAKELLSKSKSFILSGLMVSIYACTDKLMLKQLLDEASVGHYAMASSLSLMWSFALNAVIDSMLPGIVKLHAVDKQAFEKRNKLLYAIVFYSSIVVSLAICLLAEPIVSILYGEEYLPAVVPLRIIVWYTAFSHLGGARDGWVVCENKQKYLKYIYFSAAVLNVALNFLLIPRFGASGAAAASLVTQIGTSMLLPALIRPLRPNAKLMLDAILLRGLLPGKKEG